MLEGDATIQQKLVQIREAMHRIGVLTPNEHTLRLPVAITLCCSQQHSTPPEQKYAIFKQLRALLHASRPYQFDLPHLTSYPSEPNLLFEGWRTFAYTVVGPCSDVKLYAGPQMPSSVDACWGKLRWPRLQLRQWARFEFWCSLFKT